MKSSIAIGRPALHCAEKSKCPDRNATSGTTLTFPPSQPVEERRQHPILPTVCDDFDSDLSTISARRKGSARDYSSITRT